MSSAVRVSQLLRTSHLKAPISAADPFVYDADSYRWLRNGCLPWYFTDCAV